MSLTVLTLVIALVKSLISVQPVLLASFSSLLSLIIQMMPIIIILALLGMVINEFKRRGGK